MQDIFIGVDGGGTKSKVRVENNAGLLIGQAVDGPANIRLSVEKSWRSIYHALDEVLKPAGISLEDKHYRFHIGLGLAGCENVEKAKEFLAQPHPFATIELISDAHVACLGAHKAKDGAIIIIGTGVVGYQIQNGEISRVSGWGFPYDDEGSGAWLGLEATRLTFQWLDHRAEKSSLVDDIFEFFNRDLDHFVAWASHANSSEYARLAPLVINHSQQGEVAAVKLMKQAAHAIDRVWSGLIKMQRNSEHPLPCCLFGGIAPFVEPWLGKALHASLTQRQADANMGAIMMIRQCVTNKSSA